MRPDDVRHLAAPRGGLNGCPQNETSSIRFRSPSVQRQASRGNLLISRPRKGYSFPPSPIGYHTKNRLLLSYSPIGCGDMNRKSPACRGSGSCPRNRRGTRVEGRGSGDEGRNPERFSSLAAAQRHGRLPRSQAAGCQRSASGLGCHPQAKRETREQGWSGPPNTNSRPESRTQSLGVRPR